MKIGITGQDGFIGRAVSEALSSQNHDVIALDRHTRFSAINSSLAAEYPNSLDWVLHFAAATSIEASFEDPFFTYSNNLESTLIALKIAHCSKSPLLFMSSYVYSQPKYLPIDERHPVVPTNPYMASKIVGEEICRQFSDMLKIPLVILRAFYIYGDSGVSGRLIPDILESIRKGTPIALNDPTPKRDYLYIKDFVLLILKIVLRQPIGIGTYNVGYGRSYSNLEVARMARGLANSNCEIAIRSKPRPHDIQDCRPDINLLKKTFSWEPKYSLEEGLGELIQLKEQKVI